MPMGRWYYWRGYSPEAAFGGLGWLVYDALKEGPKDEEELTSWVRQRTNVEYSLTPLLDWWVARGLVKKGSDGKYSLVEEALFGPWWAYVPVPSPAKEEEKRRTLEDALEDAEESVSYLEEQARSDRTALAAYSSRVKELTTRLTNLLG